MNYETLENLVKKTIEAGRPWEGSADAAELEFLADLAMRPGVKLIGEIGFNAGLSSYAFLESNPKAQVYSFDLGEYDYIKPAKAYIDVAFPGRHKLIIGDSLKTVPEFHRTNPELRFDLIFVDGGHDYEMAKADLLNMKMLATKDTLLVTDDLTPWKPWGEGPTKAWTEALNGKLVTQEELWRDGKKVDKIEPPGDRSWVLGRYVF